MSPCLQNYLNVAGGGNYQNGQNWHANGAVAGGAKVFESANQRHAIGVHGNYGQSAVNYPVTRQKSSSTLTY